MIITPVCTKAVLTTVFFMVKLTLISLSDSRGKRLQSIWHCDVWSSGGEGRFCF